MAVLDVIDLSITIHGRQGDSRVVDDVTLSVAPGTVVGCVVLEGSAVPLGTAVAGTTVGTFGTVGGSTAV